MTLGTSGDMKRYDVRLYTVAGTPKRLAHSMWVNTWAVSHAAAEDRIRTDFEARPELWNGWAFEVKPRKDEHHA